jgi:hypothetical protein
MALLRITRKSEFKDFLRAYKVIVDGNVVGRIRHGETKEFPVTSGEHDLSLRIDWCGSDEFHFTVAEGDVINFNARCNTRVSKLGYRRHPSFFGPDPWILLTEKPKADTILSVKPGTGGASECASN